MNKRFRWGYLAAALAAVIFVAFSGYAQEDVKKVDDSAFSHHVRPAVPFDHDAHNEKAGIEDCSTCHHVFKDGKKLVGGSSEGRPCSECHLAKGDNSMDLIKAYHDQCKGCHMERGKGPVTCAECHPNK